MRSGKNFLALSILFFVFALVFSVVFWQDVSFAAKIGLFVLGFGSGIMMGQWSTKRNVYPRTTKE